MQPTDDLPVLEPVLQVEGLTKRYGEFTAVDGVSFTVRPGETVGVLGPNGAGKTTTIHMILGLVTPTSGSARILGIDPNHDRSALEHVAFTATYVSLPQTLTIRENLRVFARMYGVRNAEPRIDDILQRLDITHLADRPARHLSSGQSTMAHVAKSLLSSPRLLLLDEPTSSLDPDAADRARRQIQRFAREEGITQLITSHNMKEVEELCDRILFIRGGRLVAEGTADQLYERFGADDMEAVFLKIARDAEAGTALTREVS
jgi:ABC-2 type transport system ATP-binding protein